MALIHYPIVARICDICQRFDKDTLKLAYGETFQQEDMEQLDLCPYHARREKKNGKTINPFYVLGEVYTPHDLEYFEYLEKLAHNYSLTISRVALAVDIFNYPNVSSFKSGTLLECIRYTAKLNEETARKYGAEIEAIRKQDKRIIYQ